jgi:hypothetical protein
MRWVAVLFALAVGACATPPPPPAPDEPKPDDVQSAAAIGAIGPVMRLLAPLILRVMPNIRVLMEPKAKD